MIQNENINYCDWNKKQNELFKLLQKFCTRNVIVKRWKKMKEKQKRSRVWTVDESCDCHVYICTMYEVQTECYVYTEFKAFPNNKSRHRKDGKVTFSSLS